MRTTSLLSIFLLGALAAGAALQSQPAPSQGQELFEGVCAKCHGEDGRGQTPKGKRLKVPDFHSDKVRKLTLPQIIRVIVEGKDDMPPHERKLTPQQIRAVAEYVIVLRDK